MSKKIEMADEYVKMAEKDMAYAPEFHFTPPTGWMNDPNGLCQYQGIYHLFISSTRLLPAWDERSGDTRQARIWSIGSMRRWR